MKAKVPPAAGDVGREGLPFNLKLAAECADAFCGSTGLGCTVSDAGGELLYEAGGGCASCRMCALTGAELRCREIQQYGMLQSERFGGQYIYYCAAGLTCFTSPIVGEAGSLAKLTVGPFLMYEEDDYVQTELIEGLGLAGEELALAREALGHIPRVPPEQVTSMSNLLFMAVGFLNNVAVCNRMLEIQGSDSLQGQIGDYILRLKRAQEDIPPYPLEKERGLLRAIAEGDRPLAQQLLNELLGHVFFTAGGDFEGIKAHVCELLVLISRAAVDGGADPEYTCQLGRRNLRRMGQIATVEELCFWLAEVLEQFMGMVFQFAEVRHLDVVHKAVRYIRGNYAKKLSLEEVAQVACLSPSYFSKVFKRELGCSFNAYLNGVRVEKGKALLLDQDIRLVDIANLIGFEDQSYFTKVFKKSTGVSPCKFREAKGRAKTGV